MIAFQMGPDQITLWQTEDAFIDEAISRVGSSANSMAGLGDVVYAPDCDPQWSFHAPYAVGFWFSSPPFSNHCDALPSEIAGQPSSWNPIDNSWCPLSVRVLSVDDRR